MTERLPGFPSWCVDCRPRTLFWSNWRVHLGQLPWVRVGGAGARQAQRAAQRAVGGGGGAGAPRAPDLSPQRPQTNWPCLPARWAPCITASDWLMSPRRGAQVEAWRGRGREWVATGA